MVEFLNIYVFHWVPEKAIYIGGHSLPWDARCNGIYVGFGVGILWMVFSGRGGYLPPRLILTIITLMFTPLFIDVLSLLAALREPSNNIRYLTGILFGGVLSAYLYPAFVFLVFSKSKRCAAMDSIPEFGFFFAACLAAFIIKDVDHIYIYRILYSLSIFGFGSLFVILLVSVSVLLFGVVTQYTYQKQKQKDEP